MSTTDFPILDADRSTADAEYNRHICDVFPPVEPHIPELDTWVTMPVRLAHSQAAGCYIELGPYDLDANDIRALRRILAAYDDRAGHHWNRTRPPVPPPPR